MAIRQDTNAVYQTKPGQIKRIILPWVLLAGKKSSVSLTTHETSLGQMVRFLCIISCISCVSMIFSDASKFGAAYLSKLGWSAGGGLGAEGDGRTTHIKVSQKLDLFGIGAAHTKDPNGIAWKQNKDFESLLRRLNGEAPANTEGKVEGFVRAGDEEKTVKDEDIETNVTPTAGSSATASSSAPATTSTTTPTRTVTRHSHRAHSARYLAAKRLATQSTASMNEILGIPRSESTSASQTTASTPLPDAQPELKVQELTTNSQSVMDYFRAKLLAKSNGASPASVSPAVTPAKVEMPVKVEMPAEVEKSAEVETLAEVEAPAKEKKRSSKKRKTLEKSGDDPDDPAPEEGQDDATPKDPSRKKSKKRRGEVSDAVGTDVPADKSERKKKKCRRDVQ